MAGSVPELAWAAGFAEGEGCWYNSNNGTVKHYPRFSVAQVDRYVLDRFRAAIGGFGNISGPRTIAGRPNASPIYSLNIYGLEKVQAVTAMLWSFLGPVKREQAASTLNRANAVWHRRRSS